MSVLEQYYAFARAVQTCRLSQRSRDKLSENAPAEDYELLRVAAEADESRVDAMLSEIFKAERKVGDGRT